MTFKIHIKYIREVKEIGSWVRITLKNGLILTDKVYNWVFSEPWITHE